MVRTAGDGTREQKLGPVRLPFDLNEHRCEVWIQWQFIDRIFGLDRADAAIDHSLVYLHAEPFKIYFLPSHGMQQTGAEPRALVDQYHFLTDLRNEPPNQEELIDGEIDRPPGAFGYAIGVAPSKQFP